MLPVLGAEAEAFSIKDSVSGVVTKFTGGMQDVATQGLDLITKAAPFIIAIVGAGVVIRMGIKWLKSVKGN